MIEKAESKFREYLSSQSLKYTPERRKIFREIADSREHFAADELYMKLKTHNRRVSRATVYRTLDLLVKLGLVRKVCMGVRSSVYENVLKWKRHGHLVCIKCGKLEEFSLDELESTFSGVCDEFDFEPNNRCVQIFGTCHNCKSNSAVKVA